MYTVTPTPDATPQINALTGKPAKAFWAWVEDVRHRGCAAMGYRLTGAPLDTVCCTHLYGAWRVLAAFPAPGEVLVIGVGEHIDGDPADVYRGVYDRAEVDPPAGPRTKPACCGEDGSAPAPDEALIEAVSQRVRRAGRRGRRRQR